MVGDGDFVNADAFFRELGGDFGLESEAVLLDRDGLEDFAPHGFVAGLHIREVEVGEHVREQGQEFVPHGVPEIQHAVLLGADKAGAEDRIGFSFEDRVQQDRIFGWIIFHISILDNDDIRRGVGNASAQGRALALVFFVVVDPYARIGILDPLEFLTRAVARGIINDNQLGHLRLLQNNLHNIGNSGPFVIDRHDDGETAFFHRFKHF